jgi:hypothetical protein
MDIKSLLFSGNKKIIISIIIKLNWIIIITAPSYRYLSTIQGQT